jgi:hypothetical protein
MRILLDNHDTNLTADTVGAALREASVLAERAGRLIVEVSVDGVAWSEEDLASAELAARSAGELRCATVHPAELLRDTFANAADAVLNAESIQRGAAQLLQRGQSREAYDLLAEALAIWGSVQTAISQGLALGILSRESIAAGGIDLDGTVQSLDAQLRRLRDAMVAQDATAIADCLLYEFPSTGRAFAAMLADLAKASNAALSNA